MSILGHMATLTKVFFYIKICFLPCRNYWKSWKFMGIKETPCPQKTKIKSKKNQKKIICFLSMKTNSLWATQACLWDILKLHSNLILLPILPRYLYCWAIWMCYKLINGLNHSDQRHMKDFSLVNFINTVQLTISNKHLALKILKPYTKMGTV